MVVYRDANNNAVYDAGDTLCSWSDWVGSTAWFNNCGVGSTVGSAVFRCAVNLSRSYQSGSNYSVTVTVTPSLNAIKYQGGSDGLNWGVAHDMGAQSVSCPGNMCVNGSMCYAQGILTGASWWACLNLSTVTSPDVPAFYNCGAARDGGKLDGNNAYCCAKVSGTYRFQPAPLSETNCSDGSDNDCDGFIDEEDADCSFVALLDVNLAHFPPPAVNPLPVRPYPRVNVTLQDASQVYKRGSGGYVFEVKRNDCTGELLCSFSSPTGSCWFFDRQYSPSGLFVSPPDRVYPYALCYAQNHARGNVTLTTDGCTYYPLCNLAQSVYTPLSCSPPSGGKSVCSVGSCPANFTAPQCPVPGVWTNILFCGRSDVCLRGSTLQSRDGILRCCPVGTVLLNYSVSGYGCYKAGTSCTSLSCGTVPTPYSVDPPAATVYPSGKKCGVGGYDAGGSCIPEKLCPHGTYSVASDWCCPTNTVAKTVDGVIVCETIHVCPPPEPPLCDISNQPPGACTPLDGCAGEWACNPSSGWYCAVTAGYDCDANCDGSNDSCNADCDFCGGACGNGNCDSGETCTSCPLDCGPCPPLCGNSIIETGEACDDGLLNGVCPRSCSTTCTNNVCSELCALPGDVNVPPRGDENNNFECDYDTQHDCLKGDSACCVDTTAVSAPSSVFAGAAFNVTCTASVHGLNSIRVYRDANNNGFFDGADSDCGWNPPPDGTDAWLASPPRVRIACTAPGAPGTYLYRCGVYDERSYDCTPPSSTLDPHATVTVMPTPCSGYLNQSSCEANSCCWPAPCSGNKSASSSGSCLEPTFCSSVYSCLKNSCGALCDGTVLNCNVTTCFCAAGFVWNGSACVVPACSLTNLSFALNDTNGNTLADIGETVVIRGDFSGDCSAATHVQIDAYGYPCSVQYVGGNIQGIHNSSLSLGAGLFNASWTVPFIPPMCGGKSVTATAGALWQGTPDIGTWMISASNLAGSLTFAPYAPCTDFFDGPRDGSCSEVTESSYRLNWNATSTWFSPNDSQVLRVGANRTEVEFGCPFPTTCVVRTGLPLFNDTYPVSGLAPGTLYWNRVAALCREPDGHGGLVWRWKDRLWNCTTPDVRGNLSGRVWADLPGNCPANVRGATVSVAAPPGFSLLTNATCGYRITDIPSGSWFGSALHPGFRSQVVNITIISSAEVTRDFILTNGSCESCTDWEGRCSAACSATAFCPGQVPDVCDGAFPGEWRLNGSQYILCCGGFASPLTKPRVVSSVVPGGCMRDLVSFDRLVRYQGEVVTLRTYTWKPCGS